MVRSLTSAVSAEIVVSGGVSLVSVVKIDWGGGLVTYHSDGSFSFSSYTTLDDLYEVSPVGYRRTAFKSVAVGSCSVVLCDTDKTYYNRLKSYRLVKATATVYQHFEGLTAPTDFVKLMEGEILSPVLWDETKRTLTFEIVPPFSGTKQIPFSPSEEGTTNADTNTHRDFWGAAFPTPFGKVVDIPCQKVDIPLTVKLATAIDESNNINVFVDTEPPEDGIPFSSPTTSRDYYIDEERITGYFGTGSNAKRLTITSRNNVKLTTQSVSRPSSATDPDALLANVLYITSGVQVVGNWLQMTSGNSVMSPASPTFYNFCYKQVGNKCWFTQNWKTSAGTNSLIHASGSACSFNVRRYSSYSGTRWTHQPGTTVRRLSPTHTYVFSDTPTLSSGTISRVRAWRNVPVVGGPVDGLTYRALVKVPSGYYSVTRNNSLFSHALVNRSSHAANTIEFDPPLSMRHQGWEDDTVYVSLETDFHASDERNPANIIKYILENYTNLTPDSSSFATVASQVASFDADFVLLEPRDALEVCSDIAWQARCGLVIVGSTVKIKYLSVGDPTGSYEGPSLTDDIVVLDSMTEMSLSEYEDLVTVFVAKYRETNTDKEARTIVKRVNTSIYGEIQHTFNFFIYSRSALVQKSVDFWAGRLGNTWKLWRLKALLPAIQIEPFDFVNLAIKDFDASASYMSGSMTSVRGVVEEVKYLDDGTVDLVIWLPIKAGGSEKDSAGWVSVSAPSTINPLSGLSTSSTDEIEAVAEKE